MKKRKSKRKADRIDQLLRNQIGIMEYMRLQCGDNLIGKMTIDTFSKLIDETVSIIKVREVLR